MSTYVALPRLAKAKELVAVFDHFSQMKKPIAFWTSDAQWGNLGKLYRAGVDGLVGHGGMSIRFETLGLATGEEDEVPTVVKLTSKNISA